MNMNWNPDMHITNHYLQIISILQKNTMPEIMPQIGVWSSMRGHTDYADRAYYPLPKDIQNLAARLRKSKR